MLVKETKDLNKCKDVLHSQFGRLNIIKAQHNKINSSQIDTGHSIIQEKLSIDIDKTVLNFNAKEKDLE